MLFFLLLAALFVQVTHKTQTSASVPDPNAKLLFKSGFENFVSLVPVSGGYSQ